jgi:predicted acyl esterase
MISFRPFFYFLFLFIGQFWILTADENPKPDMTIMVPMSDGIELATDIYLPDPQAKSLPCILLRGPAGRHSNTATLYAKLAKAGYAVAIQDTRATKDEGGKSIPFYTDGWGPQKDGYDAIEWLAKHPITNGKIGTLGLSNMGITQILMAPTAPPSLKCQYIGAAAASLYHHAIFPGGQLLKNQVEGWLNLLSRDPSILKMILSQSEYSDFWSDFNAMNVAHKVQAPAVHQGGWYDTFIQGTIDAFTSRQEKGGEGAKGKQKLLIGPWVHRWPATLELGDFEVPKEGREPPFDLGPKRWFDFYLKGISNQTDQIPSVVYYVMGPFDGTPSSGNRWKTADTWPVPHQDVTFYLAPEKTLLEGIPPRQESRISYKHNSENPVPTIGGRNLFLAAGPMDQQPIEKRDDVILFTTPPLKEDLEVTGRIIAKLGFAADHHDNDIAVRLTDVYPDGKSILIADGIARAKNVLKDSPKEVEVDLWSTSIVFAKGHRIRVSVTGSNFPRFEKNLTKPDEWVTHQLYLGGKVPSRIILPVVRKSG